MRLCNRVLFQYLLFLLTNVAHSQGTWDTVYVDQSRSGGNGKTWDSAFCDLSSAIRYGQDRNVVALCAKGVYYPDTVSKKFIRTSGYDFKLIGGYPNGCRSNTTQRAASNRVILSGDLQKDDSLIVINQDSIIDTVYHLKGDNAKTVLELVCSGANTITVDQITVQCGDNEY